MTSFLVVILAGCAADHPPAASTESIPDEAIAGDASPGSSATIETSDYEIITLLPFDAIPSIDDPRFYAAEEADQEYEDHELVIGVAVDGEARAYPIDLLSRHEIVNDTIAGHPIAVTW